MAASNDSLTQFLSMFHCISPVFPNDNGSVITIRSDASLQDAFKKMIDFKVLSIPVVDEKTYRPLFALSLMHVVAFLLKKFGEDSLKKDFYHKIINQWLHGDKSQTIALTKLSTVEKFLPPVDDAYVVKATDSLMTAVKLMINKGCHRVLVLDANSKIVNVITQSRIMDFIAVMIDRIPKTSKTLSELELGRKDVLTILDTELAAKAFQMMVDKDISGLAVVNSEGTLIGNISVTDIKLVGYTMEYWDSLGLTVYQYLSTLVRKKDNRIQSKALTMATDHGIPTVVCCRESDTLAWVIKTFQFYKVHRIFVVDASKKPIGVISLYDVLKLLLE